jgi:Ca-activated chloride channel homolog
MIFLHESFLWLSLIPLMFMLYIFISKKSSQNILFSDDVYKKLTQGHKGMANEIRVILFSLSAIMMIIALAQPVMEKDKIKLNQKAIDIIVAMDISRSMEAKDAYPNRLEWAKKKILNFIDMTQIIRVGVMAFAQSAYVVTPITEDKDVAKYLVDNLDTKSITENGTNLLQLLDTSNQQLKDSLHKYLLLITDGGDNENFDEEIAYAKEHKLALFILSVGTKKGAPIEDQYGNFLKKDNNILLTHLNENVKELALQTGGVYIQSISSDEDIKTMLKEIKKIAQSTTVASKEIRSFVEYFSYFLIAAALLLFMALHSIPRRQNLNALLLALILIPVADVKASITDFQTIKQAKEAYDKNDFKTAQSTLESLTKETPSDEANYNIANTLYKQKKYDEAIKKYQSIPDSSHLKNRSLHNLGNAYAQNKKLDEAIKSYEKSLEIKEDQQTRENLEAVKKMKQEQEQKKDDKSKDDKENKDNKKNDKKDQDKKSDKDKKNKDKKSDKKDKDSKDQKKSDKKGEKKEKKKKGSDQEKKDEKKNKEPKPSKADKEKSKTKEEKSEAKPMQRSQKDLTDKEEKKLLQQLQMKKGQTFRYKIPSKFQKEEHNDKPW